MRMLLLTWKTKCFSPEKFLQRNSGLGRAQLCRAELRGLQSGENLAAAWSRRPQEVSLLGPAGRAPDLLIIF
ncbi:hypothetical protein AV530_005014 [Patagioenas fasciata monilis]|uniref:Uncharacterized protein n=1 Tax=Patagioenas fasciata monilis TaxID=372326 RepID=A0A1V4K3Z2_PATFA|nr:hypothetical protein AV530_005014 [Patagioenas fasciata monilis]